PDEAVQARCLFYRWRSSKPIFGNVGQREVGIVSGACEFSDDVAAGIANRNGGLIRQRGVQVVIETDTIGRILSGGCFDGKRRVLKSVPANTERGGGC